MDVLIECRCGLDVHKAPIVACLLKGKPHRNTWARLALAAGGRQPRRSDRGHAVWSLISEPDRSGGHHRRRDRLGAWFRLDPNDLALALPGLVIIGGTVAGGLAACRAAVCPGDGLVLPFVETPW
jgi:hypothetical protein